MHSALNFSSICAVLTEIALLFIKKWGYKSIIPCSLIFYKVDNKIFCLFFQKASTRRQLGLIS